MPTIRFPGGSGAPYINGFGLSGTTWNVEAEIILQDFSTSGQGIASMNTGGTEYWFMLFQPEFNRFIIGGEAAGASFGQGSYSGFGWAVGQAVTLRLSANAGTLTCELDDGAGNVASASTGLTNFSALAATLQIMTDIDNVEGFQVDMDSLTVNLIAATGGDTFTGTAAEWNSGNASAPQFSMNGTVSAAPSTADSVTPTGLEAASEVGTPAIGQVHALTAAGLDSASEVGTPTIGQTNVLTPVGLEAASELGTPAVGQVHALSATGLEATSEVGSPTAASVDAVIVQEYSYHHSGTNHDGTGSSELTDARTHFADMAAADADVTYTVSGQFIWVGGAPGTPTGAQEAPAADNYAVSGWTGLSSVTDVFFQHDNFDANQRDPDANGGVPVTNYVDDFLGMVDAWETNASPSGSRTYWVNSYMFEATSFLSSGVAGATPTEINNWIAASLDETTGGYAVWSDNFVAQVQAARPALDIRHMDINRVWISTYQNTALGNVAFDDLFVDGDPHGLSDSAVMVGMIQYIYETGRRPDASYAPSAGDGISSEIINNWSNIVDHAYSEIVLAASSANDIEAASEVGTPTVGQIHALTADGIEASSEVGTPSVGQVHDLTATSVESASEVGTPTAGHATTGQLIVNDYFLDAWTHNQPFADLMRLSQRGTSTTRDANGWPTGTTEYYMLTDAPSGDSSLTGRYRIEWEGTGTLTTNLANQTSGAGWIEGDYTAGGIIQINITSNTAAPDNVRNITCVKTDNAGLTFRPEYTTDIAGIRALRFMDWMGTNGSDEELWADRPTLNSDTWAGSGPWGPPIEIMVQLANETGIRPWFNIPHLATDNYVTEMATYIRDNLNPSLEFIIEYSNECWNTSGGFTQSAYFQTQAAADPDLGSTNQWMQWAGRRAAECMDIFTTVFVGQTSRLTRICGMQTDFLSLSEDFLDAPDLPVTPADSFDALGVTSYIFGSPSLNYNATNWNTILATDSGSGEAQALRQMYDWALADLNGDLATNWGIWDAEATTRSKELWMYEGGIHMAMQGITTNDNARAEELLRAWVRSVYYADIYQKIIAEWEGLTNSVYLTQYATYNTENGNPYWYKDFPGGTVYPVEETLDAYNTNSTLPTITLPDLGTPSPVDLEVASEVGTPAVGQIHALTAGGVEAGSEVGSPAIGQIHVLSPATLTSASEVGAPAIGQVHALSATGLVSASEVESPAITIEGLLSPLDLVSTSEVGTPAVGQVHRLSAVGIEAAFDFTLPAFPGGPFTPIFIDSAQTKRAGRVSTYEV